MSGSSDVIAPWLLRSKITPPRQLLSVLPRPALVALLDKGAEGALIILEAPGGYGKTCLLSEWKDRRQEQGETVCWLSVDEDDDADTFLAYLAFAAHASGVDVSGSELMSFEHYTEKNALQSIYQLLSQLERHPSPVRLIIDDCERLSENVRHSVMPLLLRRLPENCTLILASREAAGINTVDIEHRGLVVRIGPRHLRFSQDELKLLWGARVTPRQLARIEDQTEGWPVLVRLLLSAADIGEFDIRHIDDISHNDSSITTYFEQKILSRLDVEMRHFLIKASVFDDLSDAIMEEILGVPQAYPLREKLDSLEAFIAPISGDDGGYRLHPMMRDYLLHKLEDEHSQEFQRLQEKAAHWYSEKGNHVRAVRHALASKESRLLCDILDATCGLRLWLKEGLIEFRPIDRMLDEKAVLSSPSAGFMRCIILMKSGKQYEAGVLYDRIIEQHQERFKENELLSMSAFACKIMLSIYRGLYIPIEEIETFEKSASETASLFTGYVLTMKCVSAHQCGLFHEAIGHAERAIAYFRAVGSVYGEFYIHLHLGMVDWLMDAEHSHGAAFAQAKDIIRQELSYDTGVKPLLEILKLECDHEALPLETKQFQRLANVVVSLMKGEGWLDIYASAFRTLSEKQYGASGLKEALLSLESFAAFSSKNDMRYLLDICFAERSLLLAASGRRDEAVAAFEKITGFKEDPQSYLHIAPWRAGEAVGEAALYLLGDNASKTDLEMWRSYRDLNLDRGNKRAACRLGALLAARSGGEDDLGMLNRSIGPQFARAFWLCHDAMSEKYDFQGAEQAYTNVRDVMRLVQGKNEDSVGTVDQGQSILTEKELTVLRQLATGQSDKQIALVIGVTEHGVRYHLKNIYLKLGAQNRLDAVQKGRALGIPAAGSI
ncbi:MAG: hypothetical protein CMI63_17445 [Parvularcula sp.]|nr:hypothetical protein [Parvularcula sp.]